MNRPQLSTADRVSLAMQQATKPAACEKCGSVFFFQVHAYMFTASSYGVRPVSASPQTIYVCPCGEPLVPANLAGGAPGRAGSERDLFVQSMKAAMDHRKKHNLDHIAETVASVAELHAVQADIQQLTTMVADLANGWVRNKSIEGPVVVEGLVEGDGPFESVPLLPAEVQDDREPSISPVPVPAPVVRTGRLPKAAVPNPNSEPVKPSNGPARSRMRRQGGH